MDPLPTGLPRVSNFENFEFDPFAFLRHARDEHGNAFVLREGNAIFSRATECPGTIALFGTEFQRAVFSDIDTFGLPQSAALKLGLPDNLINLNRSLHSMLGDEHALQKRFLNKVLSEVNVKGYEDLILTALDECTEIWDSIIDPLQQMRELMFKVGCRVLFGDHHVRCEELSNLLRAYFQLRREVSSSALRGQSTLHEELSLLGHSLDAELRIFVRDCRADPANSGRGILAKVATLEVTPGNLISEDEAVGHSNIFFVSISEPMAVSMTWILLILSQLPELRAELRDEIRTYSGGYAYLSATQRGKLKLLRRVIDETLRVLPPNAFMVRITKVPTNLGGFDLPVGTEIVLCPFLAHRDVVHFAQPETFSPSRWLVESPSPFEYFPFGAGGHVCIGRQIALHLITTALVYLLFRFDLVLSKDQEIDWRLHIMFMPKDGLEFSVSRLCPDELISKVGGKLLGPVGKLFSFG
ncbi:MAG: cytochrome P450 [Akkermansiaceae bacterium]|nr:cytochrome P450 [Akkermansiaceae bacterium]